VESEPELPGEDGGPEEGDVGRFGPAAPAGDAAPGGEEIEESGEAGEGEQGVALKDQDEERRLAEGEGEALELFALTRSVEFVHRFHGHRGDSWVVEC
jgi:hypothetical protein